MNNAVFGKTMKKMRNHRGIKLVTTKPKRNYLVSDPNYHTTIFSLALEISKTQILGNKPFYLGLLRLLWVYQYSKLVK